MPWKLHTKSSRITATTSVLISENIFHILECSTALILTLATSLFFRRSPSMEHSIRSPVLFLEDHWIWRGKPSGGMKSRCPCWNPRRFVKLFFFNLYFLAICYCFRQSFFTANSKFLAYSGGFSIIGLRFEKLAKVLVNQLIFLSFSCFFRNRLIFLAFSQFFFIFLFFFFNHLVFLWIGWKTGELFGTKLTRMQCVVLRSRLTALYCAFHFRKSWRKSCETPWRNPARNPS